MCEWGEERLSIRLKKSKGQQERGGDKEKPKKYIIPKFPLHSQRDALKPKNGEVTAAYLA